MVNVILGTGSHARMLKALFRLQCDMVDPGGRVPDNALVFIGVGNIVKIGRPGLSVRAALFNRFDGHVRGLRHHTAAVEGDCHKTIQVMAGAVINANAMVRHNVIVNSGAVVEHDCEIGPHCHIAPGATLCGGVIVGPGTHVGAGAVVIQGKKIGAECVIGAGSVVTKDMPGRSTWIGTNFWRDDAETP